jgi:hypothetical protein
VAMVKRNCGIISIDWVLCLSLSKMFLNSNILIEVIFQAARISDACWKGYFHWVSYLRPKILQFEPILVPLSSEEWGSTAQLSLYNVLKDTPVGFNIKFALLPLIYCLFSYNHPCQIACVDCRPAWSEFWLKAWSRIRVRVRIRLFLRTLVVSLYEDHLGQTISNT